MTWREAFHNAIVPLLGPDAVQELRDALARDDGRLIQGETALPNDWQRHLHIDGACALGFALWHSLDLDTAADVEDEFYALCEAVEKTGGINAPHVFAQFWDETPRREARRLLLAECDKALAAMEVSV